MREINEIIVHCTATRASWYADKPVEEVVKELTRWHVEDNKWSDCGYHFLVHRDGRVGSARPVARAGAHCRGRNKRSIGISLVGGRNGEEDDEFSDNFTAAQDKALRSLIKDLTAKYNTIHSIAGHNEYAAKACPCFNVEEWYNA